MKDNLRNKEEECKSFILKNRSLFLDRLQSQAELVKMIKQCMKEKEFFTFPEFLGLTEKESSTIFFCVFISSH